MNEIEKPTGLINDVNNSQLNQNTGKNLRITITALVIFVTVLIAADILLMTNSSEHLITQQ